MNVEGHRKKVEELEVMDKNLHDRMMRNHDEIVKKIDMNLFSRKVKGEELEKRKEKLERIKKQKEIIESPEKLKLLLIDFADNASKIPNLAGVILFGSAVTGDISKKSGIDLLLVFDTDHNPELGEEVKIAHEIASNISVKYDLPYPFSFVFVNKGNMGEMEPDFLWSVIKEGVVIWRKPQDILMKAPHPSLEPSILIQYSVKELNEKNKRKILRWLYTSKKRIIEKRKEKLGPGVLLIKAEKFEEIKKVFDKFDVKYSIKRFWGR